MKYEELTYAYNPVGEAYHILLKVIDDSESDKEAYAIAIREAIRYLGEALA